MPLLPFSTPTNYVKASGSTTPRTLANRFADVVNVKDFGAAGDGSTNDTAAIQAAINSAAALVVGASSGATVFFPPGTYQVSADGGNGLLMANNVQLKGSGPFITVLRWNGTPSLGGNLILVRGANVSCGFSSLSIKGPNTQFGPTSDPNCQAIVVSSPTTIAGTVTVDNCQISNFWYAIHISPNATSGNASALHVTDCDLQAYTAIQSAQKGAGTISLLNCDIHGCGADSSNLYHGIYLFPSNSVQINNCRFYNYCPTATGYGIQLYGDDPGAPAYCLISNTSIDASHAHGIITNTNGPTQIGNSQISATGYAVAAQNRVLIANCLIAGTGQGIVDYSAATIDVNNTLFMVSNTAKGQIILSTSGSACHAENCRFPYHTASQAITLGAGTSLYGDRLSFSNSQAPGVSTTANVPS
ncbi:glycosyl hydrolase family 28-related protein, partial [Singulisphaera rosea]